MKKASLRKFRILAIISIFVLSAFSTAMIAQTDDPAALKAKAQALFDEGKLIDALPIYEKLAVQLPKDSGVMRNLGFALLGQAANTSDTEKRRQIRIRARDTFIIARDLGDNSLTVRGIIDGLPTDGRDGQGFSDNPEANKVMEQAEAYFSAGKMDDAFAAYQRALELDPRCYYAALFSGDVKMQAKQWDEAEKWYQRAITIDPFRETAYRYSASPLMKQMKFDRARDRYVEAYITAPYDRLAISGLVQWGQATKTQLGHPKIDIPKTTVGPDGKKNVDITISPTMDDGSMAWIAYSTTRDEWQKTKFVKAYPNEKTYRHSVAEEADALRSVLSMAKSLKPKTLNSQIGMIEKLDKDGVLEAYILLAIPDEGIAADHPAYLRQNREKLRQYVTKYVIQPMQ